MNKTQTYKKVDLGTSITFITVGYEHLMHINKLIFTYQKAGGYSYLNFTTGNRGSLRDLLKVIKEVCSKTGNVTHIF